MTEKDVYRLIESIKNVWDDVDYDINRGIQALNVALDAPDHGMHLAITEVLDEINKKLIYQAVDEKDIYNMLDGEEGWTVPWAMFSDEVGNWWLDRYFSKYNAQRGTSSMRICRAGDCFHVDIRKCRDHKWRIEERRGEEFFVSGFVGEVPAAYEILPLKKKKKGFWK